MADVKVLLAGNDQLNFAEKGDVVDMVPSVSDWGNATVTPTWVRLVIENIPGDQGEAEQTIRDYLTSWENEFMYSLVDGAATGYQRYRVEASPEIANDFDIETKKAIRDNILERFNGSIYDQSKIHFEFDSYPEIPLDELAFVISKVAYRRFRFSDLLIDAAVASVSSGEPAEFLRTQLWVRDNIIDKLKS